MWSLVCSIIIHSSMSLSGERESLLTREMKELNSKLSTKTDELDEAIKSKYIYEVCIYNLITYLREY